MTVFVLEINIMTRITENVPNAFQGFIHTFSAYTHLNKYMHIKFTNNTEYNKDS